MTGATEAPLSAGTLLYLWGDQVVPTPGRLNRKATLPSGAVVGAADLASQVFAVSFWHLATQHVLRLEPGKRRTMGVFKTDDVGVSLVGTPGARDGYEEAILGALTREKTTYGVVRRWFGQDVTNPAKVALRPALEEIPRHGLGHLDDAGRGLVGGILKGKSELQYDSEAIKGTWTEFHRLHEAWKGFRDHDPLGALLVQSCRKAIKSREESSE